MADKPPPLFPQPVNPVSGPLEIAERIEVMLLYAEIGETDARLGAEGQRHAARIRQHVAELQADLQRKDSIAAVVAALRASEAFYDLQSVPHAEAVFQVRKRDDRIAAAAAARTPGRPTDQQIRDTLAKYPGATRAEHAEKLGIPLRTLYYRLREMELQE